MDKIRLIILILEMIERHDKIGLVKTDINELILTLKSSLNDNE